MTLNCGFKSKMEITFDRIAIRRNGNVVVNNASGSFAAGSWTGLIGANGSGKTSLLRAISGRLPVAEGCIEINGVDVTLERISRAIAIGFAPEISALSGGLTGRQYLGLVQHKLGATDRAVLTDLAGALAFEQFIDRPIASLSAGMRQRLAIYSAFIAGTQIIFLDEPFNWLDPVCAFETKKAIRSLVVEHSFTVVAALHEISALTLYCDSGLVMSAGTIVHSMSADELRNGSKDIATFESSIISHLR